MAEEEGCDACDIGRKRLRYRGGCQTTRGEAGRARRGFGVEEGREGDVAVQDLGRV